MEYIDVVDENNNFTGEVVGKNIVHEKGLFYREVIGIIVNDKDEILLQKRSPNKKTYPNKWELCYGHVSSGEMPRKAMTRELAEENGLKVSESDLIFLGIEKTVEENNSRFHNVFSYIYLIKTNNKINDYKLKADEVADAIYTSIDKLEERILNKDESLGFFNSLNIEKRLDLVKNFLSGSNKMKNAIDILIDRIKETDNPTVMGLDPRYEMLPECIKAKYGTDVKSVCEGILEYNKALIDSTYDIIPAVKPQIAFYEMFGIEGIKCFKETCKYAKEKGMIVIADIKRGDIGTTAAGYSNAYLGKTLVGEKEESFYDIDWVTVNPYLGIDGVKPFIEDCKKYNKGIFVLVKTSNKSSGELQDLKLEDGKTVYEKVAELVNSWGEELIGEHGYSSVCSVVGATYPVQIKDLRQIMPKSYFLIPGYGAQGGKAEDIALGFKDGLGGIVNASRSLMCAFKSDRWKDEFKDEEYAKATRAEAIRMRDELNQAIKNS